MLSHCSDLLKGQQQELLLIRKSLYRQGVAGDVCRMSVAEHVAV
jgi:hypothetical protein